MAANPLDPTAEQRPTPRRQYAVPVASVAGAWPFDDAVMRWQPQVETELAALRAARRLNAGISTELVLALIATESDGDPAALSESDAIGLMQLLPGTFSDMVGDGDPFDPTLNIRAGILYLNEALRQHDGEVEWAVAAYHAGIAKSLAARSGDDDLPDITLDYVDTVMNLRDRAFLLRGVAPPPPSPDSDALVGKLIKLSAATPSPGAGATPSTGVTASPSPTATNTAAPVGQKAANPDAANSDAANSGGTTGNATTKAVPSASATVTLGAPEPTASGTRPAVTITPTSSAPAKTPTAATAAPSASSTATTTRAASVTPLSAAPSPAR